MEKFNSSIGEINITVDKHSVIVNKFIENRYEKEQIINDLFSVEDFKNKIICFGGTIVYLI